MKHLLTFCIVLISTLFASAQDYQFDLKIKGMEKDTVFLVRYYGAKMYIADTAVADGSGSLSFDDKYIREGGMFAVMQSDKKGYFEILLNNEDVQIETQKGDYVGSMKVNKSKENKVFYDYIDFLNNQQKQARPLQTQLQQAKDDKRKESLQKELNKVNEAVKKEQQRIINKNEYLLVADVINMTIDVQVPDPPKDEEGNVIDKNFQRNYYVTHYWDNTNLRNDMLVRTKGLEEKLKYFFDKIVPQQQDSIIKEAHKLIAKTEEGSEMFKFLVVFATSHYQESKIMCLDAVFVEMVLKYYKTGKAFWMTKDKNKEIVERAEAMKPITCLEVAHNISLPDTSMNWTKISDLESKYTILVFWDPDCGHCKKEMPKMVEKYPAWKAMGAEVYAVSSKNNKEWKKFIRDKNFPFINVAVPKQVYEDQSFVNEIVRSGKSDLKSLNYHDTFDIFKTPTVFILDENRMIIGKNLESKGITDMLERLSEKDE